MSADTLPIVEKLRELKWAGWSEMGSAADAIEALAGALGPFTCGSNCENGYCAAGLADPHNCRRKHASTTLDKVRAMR